MSRYHNLLDYKLTDATLTLHYISKSEDYVNYGKSNILLSELFLVDYSISEYDNKRLASLLIKTKQDSFTYCFENNITTNLDQLDYKGESLFESLSTYLNNKK